jgi:hypothetical protein
MPKKIAVADIVGAHPGAKHPLGEHLACSDNYSDHGVPHRELSVNHSEAHLAKAMRDCLINHHVSPAMLARDQKRREALTRQGFKDRPRRFPTNPSTQKGNWAEILLAEYLSASAKATVPVYRLRYNPNVEQSMKGDDVLAFDLDSDPVRILVGEAKFRATPSKQAIEEIVQALTRSRRAGIPISLQFVVDRLFEQKLTELAKKVEKCNLLFAQGKLQLDHVGLLDSNDKAADHVRRNAKTSLHRLVVMSLGMSNPETAVSNCFDEIEKQK